VLTHPNKLSAVQQEDTRKAWESVHGGLQNSHRTAILQEGMDYKEIGSNMVDSQYLEGRNLSIADICRIFGVPPHLVQDLTRSTNNNIEHQGLEYVQYGQGPWAANWQNELAFSLLSTREADSIFLEFNFEHLLKGDMVAQAAFFASTIQNNVLTPDEAREKLGYNPLANGWGAVPMRQLNMRLATDPAPAQPSKPDMPPMTEAKPNGKANGLAH
jgi:HK97 family phage portal protein